MIDEFTTFQKFSIFSASLLIAMGSGLGAYFTASILGGYSLGVSIIASSYIAGATGIFLSSATVKLFMVSENLNKDSEGGE